ncbi:hypothetical protein LP419_20445 [Massilia sp. H-1]|nr:hypothetical protein LP419_20445 [Massilia sp. H-1]
MLMDGHLWAHAKTWDPEGLLSTMLRPCAASCWACSCGALAVVVGRAY